MQAGMDQYLLSARTLFSSHAGCLFPDCLCNFKTETDHIINNWTYKLLLTYTTFNN